MEKKIRDAQSFLREHHIEGWLLYDFHKINTLAYEFLEIPTDTIITRRFFYFIPKTGTPIKLVHSIESKVLDKLPGKTLFYKDVKSLKKALEEIVESCSSVAMEYSSDCSIPYLSKVDAGTVELIKSFGCDVISSAPVLQFFTSTLSEDQIKSHKNSGAFLVKTVDKAFNYIKECRHSNREITEYDVQQWILKEFEKEGFVSEHEVICAFGKNTADPHYVPSKNKSLKLESDQLVLLDIFAKENNNKAIYADICHLGFTGKKLPKKVEKALNLVKEAQDEALNFISQRVGQHRVVKGFEVDEICRGVITSQGMGQYFSHRTGHNLYTTLHGPGAHLDSFETIDERPLIPNTAYTIEPGLYFDQDFGIRLEIDILITKKDVVVTAPMKNIINYLI